MFRLLCGVVLLGASTEAPAAGPVSQDASQAVESGWRDTVRPFVASFCVDCHGHEKPKGEFDLSVYSTLRSVAKDLPHWELIIEQLEAGTMPPAKAKRRPSEDDVSTVIAWIQSVRKLEGQRNAGDPGNVLARRLSNAEFDYTIRDLTGVDIRPTREFPVDPANEAGFDNSAESLTMSPALTKKYLEAARGIADHLVLKPEGFAFASHPVVADTDRDKFCVRRVIEFYQRQRTDYADFVLAAWRYQHRAILGNPKITLEQIARDAQISPRYLETIWSVLSERSDDVGPIAAVQSLWRELPPPDPAHPEAARAGCERLRDFVVELRGRLTPEVKNLSARPVHDGAQPLVLWKNRQYVANRRRYADTAASVRPADLKTGTAVARELALPVDRADLPWYEPSLRQFCSTFPDAFVVSERARVYLDPKKEKANSGRLLSAGFHSMTGYFRDDTALSELILDQAGQRELDRLWQEFNFITGAPMRQYSSFLWFERTDSRFMRDPVFDFARAEDKSAASAAMIKKLSEVYLEKARRNSASATALEAIQEFFVTMSAQIRAVEQERLIAEPTHLRALVEFAERAFRRPLSADEQAGLLAFYKSLRESENLSHEDAVRDTLASILMSPYFSYRVDLPTPDGPRIQPLANYELASRLSYFLWSSMPDEELLARAASGDLQRADVLVSQARRMLKNPRVRGLAVEFAGNWLDFRRFDEHNSVDRGRFPAFNDELRRAMFEEPIRYFVDLVENDRPVRELLDGRHTFVNAALARHYGMPLPPGNPEGWFRVEDASKYGRGGLMPMAVFLTKNSPGLRTSPVKRGYWVVRRLLGETIPAPPANVPDLPDDEAKLGNLTLRDALARHRAEKSCAGCHARFDSLGLAFEGYGPVGERRNVDLGGRAIDTRAEFPGGKSGEGLDGLRSYVTEQRRGEFVDNLCRKLLAYGLGRTLIPSDDAILDTMRSRLAAENDRFGTLVEAIVTSPQFRNKRIAGEPSE